MTRHTGVPARRHVLVVEDDADSAEALCLLLEYEGYAAAHAGTANEACRRLTAAGPPIDAVLLDLTLPDKSGAALVEALDALDVHPCFIIVSAAPEHVLQAAARRLHAVGYLRKPFDTRSLLDMLERALRQPVS